MVIHILALVGLVVVCLLAWIGLAVVVGTLTGKAAKLGERPDHWDE